MQPRRKAIFWYPCSLYPIRTKSSIKRRSCLLRHQTDTANANKVQRDGSTPSFHVWRRYSRCLHQSAQSRSTGSQTAEQNRIHLVSFQNKMLGADSGSTAQTHTMWASQSGGRDTDSWSAMWLNLNVGVFSCKSVSLKHFTHKLWSTKYKKPSQASAQTHSN